MASYNIDFWFIPFFHYLSYKYILSWLHFHPFFSGFFAWILTLYLAIKNLNSLPYLKVFCILISLDKILWKLSIIYKIGLSTSLANLWNRTTSLFFSLQDLQWKLCYEAETFIKFKSLYYKICFVTENSILTCLVRLNLVVQLLLEIRWIELIYRLTYNFFTPRNFYCPQNPALTMF